MGNRPHPKLGSILLNARKINPENLDEAIEKQRIHRRKIGEILIMMGYLNPEELDLFLLVQQGYQHPEFHDIRIDIDLLQKIAAGEPLFRRNS